MFTRRSLLSLLALTPGVCCASRSEAAQKGVAELAKEGYWGEDDTWAIHSKLLDKPAPKLELSDWVAAEVKPEGMKDKILVVDFWATWCGPCIAAIPKNNALAKSYAEKGVLVIGACGSGRGEERMKEVAETKGIAYPSARVSKSSTEAWGVRWWPHYVVVDPKGMIRAAGIKPDYVGKVVDAILAEKQA
jgi:thiol-disulfide isomerase/thioredoxin